MKKCPKCGNPSYDGAPFCGNCGYKFPKPKVVAPKEESIFAKEQPKVKKEKSKVKKEKPKAVEKKTDDNDNNYDDSVIGIIKKNKLLIGAIVIVTLIVICGIILTAPSHDNHPVTTSDNGKYSADGVSFNYPKTWKKLNDTDPEREGAVFFKNDNNTVIELYNVTSNATSLKEITQERISAAMQNGSYIDTVRTITIDGRNSSEIIIENADGNYDRYISMLSKGELYVFKISGDSVNSVTSPDIESAINSADIA